MTVHSNTSDLADRNVVVTGGSGALGGAVLAELVGRGVRCHVPCMEPEVPAHFALADHDRVSATCGVDLTSEQSTRGYFEALPPLWGSIHLAGGFAMAPVADTSLADLERMLRLNAVTTFLCCREAVRAIRLTGSAGGRIVNVAARPVVRPAGGMVAYAASKAAVAAITEALAEELQAEGILVNAVLPSIIDSEANRRSMPQADHASWPKPGELAQTIAFLISPENALTSGALVPVYGRA
jgi:NAD(P)-dependent dehydrogenase (short-subunit alcohol dehydrogenase family)